MAQLLQAQLEYAVREPEPSLATLKAFLQDLSRLQGLYRVGSFVGLAFTLALVAVILQKFVLVKSEGQA